MSNDEDDDMNPFPDIDKLFAAMEKAMMGDMEEFFGRANFPDIMPPPKKLQRERRLPDGGIVREFGPIVWGYSATVGPDGKPIIKQFGNVNPQAATPEQALTDKREPLIDIIPEGTRLRVIAEIAGADKDSIKVEVNPAGTELSITASGSNGREYAKTVILPSKVRSDVEAHHYNNGILEIFLAKA